MSDEPVIPGMDLAVVGHPLVRTYRSEANVWWAIYGDDGTGLVPPEDLHVPSQAPSAVLAAAQARLHGGVAAGPVAITVAKVELDVCGAWMTVANAGPRPVVVRRAGWVDVRGHPAGPLGGRGPYRPADDRVGLGPGDAVVLQVPASTSEDGAGDPDDEVLDELLTVAGTPAAAVAAALRGPLARPRLDAPAAVVAVPEALGDVKQRLSDATGVPIEALVLPGYPLGDLRPELWHEPVQPPRLARLRLAPDASSPRAVRQLLDRLLASWRLDGRLDDDGVRLAASELAANAVVHTGVPQAATIRYLGSKVRVEVDDGSPVLPAPREADEVGGRGLPLVDALTSAWGAHARGEGKRVWCEVAVRHP